MIGIVSLATAMTVCTLNIHHKGTRGKVVPTWIKYVCFNIIAKVLCLKIELPTQSPGTTIKRVRRIVSCLRVSAVGQSSEVACNWFCFHLYFTLLLLFFCAGVVEFAPLFTLGYWRGSGAIEGKHLYCHHHVDFSGMRTHNSQLANHVRILTTKP